VLEEIYSANYFVLIHEWNKDKEKYVSGVYVKSNSKDKKT
jgi:hypothetical protein